MAAYGQSQEGAASKQTYDPQEYLAERYSPSSRYRKEFFDFPVQRTHELLKDLPHNLADMTVLDYGCGPTPIHTVSAAVLASEIVFAEYDENNRSELQQWLERNPNAFDWSWHFEYAVKTLEGGTENEAKQREEKVREVVKGIVHCDITEDNPIQKGYEGPYDVIISSLCIGVACKTRSDYSASVGKLMAMLKPGGRLIIYNFEREMGGPLAEYMVGDTTIRTFPVTGDFVEGVLVKHGFCDIVMHRNRFLGVEMGAIGTVFISARKP